MVTISASAKMLKLEGFTGSDQDSKNGCDIDVVYRKYGSVEQAWRYTRRETSATPSLSSPKINVSIHS
jgi:hypothetical protein